MNHFHKRNMTEQFLTPQIDGQDLMDCSYQPLTFNACEWNVVWISMLQGFRTAEIHWQHFKALRAVAFEIQQLYGRTSRSNSLVKNQRNMHLTRFSKQQASVLSGHKQIFDGLILQLS